MNTKIVLGAAAAVAVLAGCASMMDRGPDATTVLKTSFKERGIAKLDRLDQSELQKACSEAAANGKDLDAATRARLEKAALANVRYPADAGYNSGGDHDKAKTWQEEQRAAGFDIHISFGDVRDFDSCARCIDDVQTRLGPVDVLVNNAGITRDSTLRKMTKE